MDKVSIESDTQGHYRISGEMTFETVGTLCTKKMHLLKKQDQEIVVDLGNVSRADSAGLACLLEFLREAKKINTTVRFENIQDQFLSLIRVSGLEKLIKN